MADARDGRQHEARYGLLAYDTENLGDEIQSIAAAQFLPRIDTYINREHAHTFKPSDGLTYRTIMNGWFMHQPGNWPPSPSVEPLFISLHISSAVGDSGVAPHTRILSEEGVAYLRKHAPIGARDLPTMQLLKKVGIESFMSGCLTLTMPRPAVPRDENLIVVNDIPAVITERIRKVSSKRVVGVDQNSHVKDRQRRFRAAYDILEKYARASFVVTSRLHCALPCLAMGTPVLLIKSDRDPARFLGLDHLLHTGTVDGLLKMDPKGIDFPIPNKSLHLPLRKNLIKRVEKFVGHADVRNVDPFRRVLGVDPQIAQVVEAAYNSILQRGPDEAGLKMYSELLKRDGIAHGGQQMMTHLILSAERIALEKKRYG